MADTAFRDELATRPDALGIAGQLGPGEGRVRRLLVVSREPGFGKLAQRRLAIVCSASLSAPAAHIASVARGGASTLVPPVGLEAHWMSFCPCRQDASLETLGARWVTHQVRTSSPGVMGCPFANAFGCPLGRSVVSFLQTRVDSARVSSAVTIS